MDTVDCRTTTPNRPTRIAVRAVDFRPCTRAPVERSLTAVNTNESVVSECPAANSSTVDCTAVDCRPDYSCPNRRSPKSSWTRQPNPVAFHLLHNRSLMLLHCIRPMWPQL